MDVSIKFSKVYGVYINVNGKPHYDVLSFEERKALYLKALNDFDKDIDFLNNSLEPVQLSLVGGWLRHDCKGHKQPELVFYYYFYHVLKHLGVNYIVNKSYYVSNFFLYFLKSKGIEVSESKKIALLKFVYFSNKKINESLKLAIRILKGALQAPSSKLQAPSSKLQAPSSKLQAPSSKQPIFLCDVPKKVMNHRYGVHFERIHKESLVFYTVVYKGYFLINKTKYFYSSMLSIKEIFFLLLESRKIKNSLSNYLNNGRLYSMAISNQGLYEIIELELIRKSHEVFNDRFNISGLYIEMIYGDSYKRQLLISSNKANIPSFNFIPRALDKMCPSERLQVSDWKWVKKAEATKNYVIDTQSNNILVEQGVSPEKIKKENRYVDASHESPFIKPTFVILLGTEELLNIKLLNDLFKSDALQCNKCDVVVRSHPSFPITRKTKNILNSKRKDWINGRENKYKGPNSIAITISSTAIIELALSGSGAVWCPYLFEESMLRLNSMEKLGKVCFNEEDLVLFLEELDCHSGFHDFARKTYTQALKNYA